ncbi:MAG: M23 family metallopeptidase, partial [Flavobacteriales bacterium]|nr:M23 family metallopeptidase [Flavobacteriales bacterium]
MADKKSRKDIYKAVKKRLTTHLKFILFDEEKFHEIFSARMRPVNLLISVLSVATLLIAGTVLLIRYTPLRYYLVTDDAPALRRQTTVLLSQLEAMSEKQSQNENYIIALREVLSGEIKPERIKDSMYVDSISAIARKHLMASSKDSTFRHEVEQRQMDAMKNTATIVRNILSLTEPIRGAVVSAPFDNSTDHLWIGLSAKPNMPFFAVYQGTVLYKDWTPSSGNVLIIQHSENMTTVYKNVGLITK